MEWPYATRKLPLGRKVVSAVGRVDYVRVGIQDGKIEPLATSGASILSSTTRADGFMVVPRDREGYAEGEEIQMYLYGQWSALSD
jgi:molybdopterin molybdotransferase